jgi:hypothetical protein
VVADWGKCQGVLEYGWDIDIYVNSLHNMNSMFNQHQSIFTPASRCSPYLNPLDEIHTQHQHTENGCA